MALYKYIRNQWKNPTDEVNQLWRQRLIQWRHENSTVRVEYPTRLDRARSLGYRSKEGFIIIRQRVLRGGHKRPKIVAGRRPKHFHHYLALKKSYQVIAEERVQTKYTNLVVLNSYYLAADGRHKWYEIILVDPENPSIKSDHRIKWICDNRSRVFHGKTHAGRKSRGLRGKGKGFEKARPSRSANKERRNKVIRPRGLMNL
ncbi:50S ribosomal protein L15e [Candidatus Woesearchaeota archaeon]|nr:50S ribosomal protein L15e [Candidatus Woesearchaeota archaeon]